MICMAVWMTQARRSTSTVAMAWVEIRNGFIERLEAQLKWN